MSEFTQDKPSDKRTPVKFTGHQQKVIQKRQQTSQQIIESLRLFLSLEHSHVQLLEQELEMRIITERFNRLEQTLPNKPVTNSEIQKIKKVNRRLANDIERNYSCPYPSCEKNYGTEISLNLHIRIKHNGGSKIDREILAKQIVTAQINGTEPPPITIQLPPGFLEEFCITYQEFLKKEISNQIKQENQNQQMKQEPN